MRIPTKPPASLAHYRLDGQPDPGKQCARYDNEHIRAAVSVVLLLGDVLIFLPILLYPSSVLTRSIAVVSAVANC